MDGALLPAMVCRNGDRAGCLHLLQRRQPRAMSTALEIDIGRLQGEIDAWALISENPPPVVTRVLFSAADLSARARVKDLCRQAGLAVREDAIGNIFARW